LREHLLDFFVAEADLVDRVTLSLEGFEVAFDVGGKEDLWVPLVSLRGADASNQAWYPIRISNVDDSVFLLRK